MKENKEIDNFVRVYNKPFSLSILCEFLEIDGSEVVDYLEHLLNIGVIRELAGSTDGKVYYVRCRLHNHQWEISKKVRLRSDLHWWRDELL
jgi:predicted transcriptional regulator